MIVCAQCEKEITGIPQADESTWLCDSCLLEQRINFLENKLLFDDLAAKQFCDIQDEIERLKAVKVTK